MSGFQVWVRQHKSEPRNVLANHRLTVLPHNSFSHSYSFEVAGKIPTQGATRLALELSVVLHLASRPQPRKGAESPAEHRQSWVQAVAVKVVGHARKQAQAQPSKGDQCKGHS